MNKKPLDDLTKDMKYLPVELRDFHDQKDLFKTIEHFASDKQKIDWISAHIYTIDIFLFFMARHGFLLKKSRSKKYNFLSLSEAVREYKENVFKTLQGIFYANKELKEQAE